MGSRARNTHTTNSDYDIAFEFDRDKSALWNQFVLDADEKPFTLQQVDLVAFRDVDTRFQENITQEGLILYEAV